MKTSRYRPICVYLLLFAFISSLFLPGISYADEAKDSPEVSVKLVNYIGNATQLSLDLTGSYLLGDTGEELNSASYIIKAEQNGLVLYEGPIAVHRSSSITLTPASYGTESFIQINKRPYLGEIRFELENGLFIRPTNKLPLEDYLKGVVPAEMPASWSLEALKAQAIAARTYTVGKMDKIMNDTVSFQVYWGFQWHENSTRAVEETRGQVLKYGGALIEALYSSSNGGNSEASESLWNRAAYLQAQPDPFDPQNSWTLSFRKQQISLEGKDLMNPDAWWTSTQEADSTISATIKKWLQQNGYENQEIKLLSIPFLAISEDRTAGNRIKKGSISLNFISKNKTGYLKNPDGTIKVIHWEKTDLPATSLRNMLGGGNVFKSYMVSSLKDDGLSYTIQGLGFGHGVGMSQYGAKAMAEKGKNVRDILAFYYPGTLLSEGKGIPASLPGLSEPPIEPLPVVPPIQQEPGSPIVASLKLSSATFNMGSNQKVQIQYKLQQPATVSVLIFDSNGVVRRVITNGSNQSAGEKFLEWDGYGLSAGVYNVVVEAKDENGSISNQASKIQFVQLEASRSSALAKTGQVKSTVIIGLRPLADFKVKPVKLLRNGDLVSIIGKQDRWYKIKSGTAVGFVPDEFIVGLK